MTTAPVPMLLAHEIVPEPAADATLDLHTKYAVARAYGFWLSVMGDDLGRFDRAIKDRIILMLAEAKLALLLSRLHAGDDAASAATWVAQRGGEDFGEWLYEAGERLGLAMDTIRPYLVPAAREDADSDEPQP